MGVYDVNGNELTAVYDVQGQQLEQCYDVQGNPLLDSNPKLRMMTFNVQRWGGINADTAVMTSIFNAYNPQIVGVQEVGTGGMRYVGTLFDTGIVQSGVYNPAGMLLNIAYSDYSSKVYDTISSETRGYQKLYIQWNGKRIAVFNTHLEVKSGQTHILQAQEFFNALQNEEYFIALGDFNVECHDTNDAEYRTVVKQFIDAGYNLCNWTTETGFVDTWFNGTTLENSDYVCPCDNIITSSNITIDEIFYDHRKIEADLNKTIDHIPVVAYLTVE